VAVKYTDYMDDDLNRDVLLNDADFIEDASNFLAKRNDTEYESSEEVYDAFMEHMRFQDTNEVTAVRDLMYTQQADDESKAEFGRLMSVFDRMEGEDLYGEDGLNTKMIGDYIEAGLTAPSTWLGIVTGGAGKLGAMAGKEAAKIGLRTVTGEVLKSAAKGAAVEGTIGLGQGAAQELSRVETGVQDEFTGGRTLMTGAASAIGGALPAGLTGLGQTVGITGKGGARAAKGLLEAGEAAEATAQATAVKNVQKAFKAVKSKDKIVNTRKQILGDLEGVRNAAKDLADKAKDPLNKEAVAAGKELMKGLSATEKLIVGLNDETLDQITAAALKLGDELKIPKDKRITEAVAEALADGKISSDGVEKILKEFNLTTDQFSYIYMAELSDAGRALGRQSQIAKKMRGDKTETAKLQTQQQRLDRLANSVQELLDQTGTGITKQEAVRISKQAGDNSKVFNFFSELDRFRLASMTSQVATTIRNTAGGSMRVALDIMDESFEVAVGTGSDILTGKYGYGLKGMKNAVDVNFKNPFAITNNLLFNQSESQVVRQLFEKNMPVEAERFYSQLFDNVDTVTSLGASGPLTKFGAKLNTLNRISDNIFKQAVFSGKLDQLVRAQRKAKNLDGGLSEVIAAGEFKNIDSDMIQEALDMSLDFVYQKYPKGTTKAHKIGQGIISAHRNLPFVVSSVIPFPRFIINQFKTVVEHTPVLAIAANKATGKQAFSAESLAKQTSGLAMFSMAANLRSGQPEENAWYEFTTDGGKTMDLRATLGPMAPFLWAADIYSRDAKGLPQSSFKENTTELFKMLGGPQFRAGTGLYALDLMYEDIASEDGDWSLKSQKVAGRFVGDMINTFTLPAATIRDLVSLEDEDKRLLDETAYTNFLDIVMARGSRSLPDFGEADQVEPRYDITQEEQLSYIDPLERQIFGVSKKAKKNPFQKEMGRLRLSAYDIYKPAQFAYEDRLIREAASKQLANKMTAFINQNEIYNDPATTDAERKDLLRDTAQGILTDIRTNVRARLLDEQAVGKEEASKYAKFLYESLPATTKKGASAAYERQEGKSPSEDYLDFLENFLPAYKESKKEQKFSKGGIVSDIFGDFGETAAKKSDDVDVLDEDMVTDADYLDELDEFELDELGYPVEVDEEAFFDKKTLETLETAGELALETLIGFTPIVGDVYDAYNVTNNLREAKYVDAAIDAIGFVPFIGNALSKGVKITVDMFKNTDPVIKKRALADFTRKEGRLPDLSDEADLEGLVQSGARQEKIVAGMATSDVDMPLFHGSLKGTDELVDPKIRAQSGGRPHAELGTASLSTSRDPLMSAETFQSGDVGEMFVARPKRGLMAKTDMSAREYDQLRAQVKEGTTAGREFVQESEMLPTQLPKTSHTEAETMIQNIEDVDVSKLKDNPELYEKVSKGLRELKQVRSNIDQVEKLGSELKSKKDAMVHYNTLKSTMKQALGLAKYTSGAGARGKYDQILNDLGNKDIYPDFIKGLRSSADMLGDTQRGKQMRDLAEAMEEHADLMQDSSVTAQEASQILTPIKERIMDITQKMNRGGLASRRT